jgi:SAM-dependent methyltransferase
MELQEVMKGSDRDAVVVREFFNGWSLYRRIVDNDYLYHRSVREFFSRWLDAFGRPFSFLDLGCGDADFSSGILRGRPLQSYTGIDLSPVALDLARQNTALLGVPCNLIAGDFMTSLGGLVGTYDIIYIGLSLHHLQRREKEFFFGELRGKLAPGGVLLIFDPVLTPGESRESYMGRWVDHAQWAWRALTVEEISGAVEHVTTSDYPEEIATLNHMAIGASFKPAGIRFTDRTDFYALMAFDGV